jgi:ATP-binding cassette, subfamily B, multidrug efflux pump
VLEDVSLEIAAGEKLAIVGPTGSGKTTLVRLLARFYTLEPGQLFLDGIDLAQVEPRDVRRRLGIVLQDFHVFSGSVADNLALGDPHISRAQIEAAARLVQADAFIRALPQGYDTPLAERGQNLSQGQRQLLAFARVIAANPEILILDEATASVDPHTESEIQLALRRVSAGRTCILIAHRLQTILEADRVLVLDRGRVRELGTHAELLALGGLYRTLHDLQFQETGESSLAS